MKRPKGPELKLSELKVPPFLSDLYWDLRDRRLLPLAALVVVAIVAVPFLLGGKSDESASPDRLTVTPPTVESDSARASKLVAVEAAPGLRNYHKRLGHRSPNNPFKQRYTAPQLAGSELGGELSSTSSTSGGSGESKATTTTTTTTTGETSGGAAPSGELRYYTTAADIKIVRSESKADGSVVHDKPVVHHRVLPPAPVPGEKQAAVVYMGVAQNHKPLLLVSDAVKGVFGDGVCLAGATVCQLLELEKGVPETFVYGEDGKVRFKITILKIELVSAGKY
jgi:hypothetical protein